MTLQVVLRGIDGVVIASDTLVSSQPGRISVADSNSKMVVKPRFVCTFAGDDYAKYISTVLAANLVGSAFESSEHFIKAVNNALEKYKGKWAFSKSLYRKILWVQSLDCSEFTIWAASYCGWNENFELVAPETPINVQFAGDEGNTARYFVEHYYKKYPMKTVSGLTKMAAHVILTGGIFNPYGVNGLEMVVGNENGFIPVKNEEIQKLVSEFPTIHDEYNRHFESA